MYYSVRAINLLCEFIRYYVLYFKLLNIYMFIHKEI